MNKIFIDGQVYEVEPGQNLLHVALSQKLDLPYFCWHPALGSVGACRQCAVKQFKDENDQNGKIVMACMTPAKDGTRISIKDPEAVEFRASVIEWLMLNHPHDCPVCDEGGECHLQDMTVMTGHVYRRNRFNKRTFRNQYLGPFINHEMNRCIECYRCVRFYRDYAGGRDFDVFAAHNHVYFGRHEDGVLENEFSGNLVEVCPTGVFTDKSLKQHYTRKWDLQTAPSICVHCGLGCNTIPGERYGTLRRIRNRYHPDVNGYFLCDRGRYGYEFVNSPERIRQPKIRESQDDQAQPATLEQVLAQLKDVLPNASRLIGIGSPRASLESNFALQTLVGAENYFAGVSEDEIRLYDLILQMLENGPVPTASLHEVELSDAALVLGEDLTNTAPMLALALRQSVLNQPSRQAQKLNIEAWDDAAVRQVIQDQKGPLFIAAPTITRLDDIATTTINLSPDDIARLGFAVAHAINPAAPRVKDLPTEQEALAAEIAQKLLNADRPLVISGTSLGSQAVIQSAANVAQALRSAGKEAHLTYTVPECNSLGMAVLQKSKGLEQALHALQASQSAVLIVLENDLFRRSNPDFIATLLQAAGFVIVLDAVENQTTSSADLLLPAATYAEGDGTLVNNEGRAQRYFQVMNPQELVRESWRWISTFSSLANPDSTQPWQNLDEVLASLARQIPELAPALESAPGADYRIDGQKIPRQPHRYSGRTAMHANVNVSEPKPPADPDSALAFSMEGYSGQPPASLIARYWSPGWNSVQSLNKFQDEVAGLLITGSPGKRLFEDSEGVEFTYFDDVPDAFVPRQDEYLALPLYHIFGSEEYSRLAPAIMERSPEPYLALSTSLAGQLGLQDGQQVQLEIDGQKLRVAARILSALPAGTVGLPAGMTALSARLPAWSRLSVAERGQG